MGLYVCHQVHGSQLTVLFTLHSFLCMIQLCRRHAHISLLRPGAQGAQGGFCTTVFFDKGAFFAFRESVLLEYQQVVISSSIPLSSEHSSLPSLFFNPPTLSPYVSDSRMSLASFTLPITLDYVSAL